jgi:hypothetical protein
VILSESDMTGCHVPGEHLRDLRRGGFLVLRENPGKALPGRKQGKNEMMNKAGLR